MPVKPDAEPAGSYIPSHLRDMNRRQIYRFIREQGTTSRAEIARCTGISAPTVIKTVQFLMEQGLVEEIGEAATSVGRRPRLVRLNTALMYAAAFLMEGDFLSMGIVDILGRVICQKTIPVEPNYPAIYRLIRDRLIDELIGEAGILPEQLFGIGLALPAVFSRESAVIDSAPLINQSEPLPIGGDIRELSEKYRALVMVENDTNAQTLGEFQSGGYDPQDDLLFLSVGTGIGAGLVLGGSLRYGSHDMCGEIGSMTFDPAHRCSGKNGGWLEERIGYRQLCGTFGIDPIRTPSLSPELREEICRMIAPMLSLCIHNLNTVLDLRHIVIGGRLVETLGQALPDALNRQLGSYSVSPCTVRIEHSGEVGLIGMAKLLTDRKIGEILTREA